VVAHGARLSESDSQETSAGAEPPPYLVNCLQHVEVMQDRDHRHQVIAVIAVGPRLSCDGDIRETGTALRRLLPHQGIDVIADHPTDVGCEVIMVFCVL